MTESTDLTKLSRTDLNMAATTTGVREPELYSNKDEVIESIKLVESGQDQLPHPAVKGGATVTFNGSDQAETAYIVGDFRFPYGKPVVGVDAETVKHLRALDGYKFTIE